MVKNGKIEEPIPRGSLQVHVELKKKGIEIEIHHEGYIYMHVYNDGKYHRITRNQWPITYEEQNIYTIKAQNKIAGDIADRLMELSDITQEEKNELLKVYQVYTDKLCEIRDRIKDDEISKIKKEK